jgi:hypothetical protein
MKSPAPATPCCCICKIRPASIFNGKLSNFGACGNVDCLIARIKEVDPSRLGFPVKKEVE